ncbi:hypothetical protein [Streptomyces sp. NPDC050121]|uniref:hypothetical protein n=1 Tax=Streptomyces sp. NPDC050121 TaxID=3365601 RepID=UPI0037A432FF
MNNPAGNYICIAVQADQWKETQFRGDVSGRINAFADSACSDSLGGVDVPKDTSSNINYWFQFNRSQIYFGKPSGLK